jgi:hypothetical protein
VIEQVHFYTLDTPEDPEKFVNVIEFYVGLYKDVTFLSTETGSLATGPIWKLPIEKALLIKLMDDFDR